MARSIRIDIENNGKNDFLSKPILRTNPKLSTNVKLVVTDDNMYLESFDAGIQLSDSKYKKHLIRETGSYAYDLAKFWNKNSTPLDLAYATKREYSDFSILDSYDKQLEESYNYGTSINYSKLHDYNFKMLAPIWLDREIPTKFLIYRIENPIDSTSFSDDQNLERINEMLSNATLIKTVDFSKESSIGKYLRNYASDNQFPKSPMTVSFNKGEQTFYNGIDLEKGGFTSKGEYQYKDTIDQDKPLIEYNEFITLGFERSSMACANLINFEFLFNDEEANELSINRYFGVYVDPIKIGEGEVSEIKDDLITFSNLSHTLDLGTNPDYWSLPISDFYKRMPMLGYVKSFQDYHNIKNGAHWNNEDYQIKIDSNNQDYSLFTGIKKTNRTVDVDKNLGLDPDFLKIEVTDSPLDGDSFSLVNLKKQRWVISIVTNVNDAPPASSTAIFIEDNTGAYMACGTGATEKETLENIIASWYPTTDTFGKYDVELENINGKYQISVVEKKYHFEENHSFRALNSVTDISPVIGINISDTIIKIERTFTPIEVAKNTFVGSSSLDRGKFENNNWSTQGSLNNIATSISMIIENKTNFSTLLDGNIIYIKSPINGYNKKLAAFILSVSNSNFLNIEKGSDTGNVLNIGSDYLTSNVAYNLQGGSNKNASLYLNEDDINEISIGEYLLDINNIEYKIIDIVDDIRSINSSFKKLILNKENTNIEGIVNVYRSFNLEWGMFSAYDIYDLNFDFYDTSSSDLKELQLENNTVDYPNKDTLISAYSEKENLDKDPISYFANLVPLLENEDVSEKELEQIFNEHDRLQENNTTEFATTSRIVPTINKWSLLNSVNIRESSYFLNVNEVFGETNFAPNLEVEGRDETKMTHEWFYLDKFPEYASYLEGPSFFSYINLASDINFDSNNLKSIDFDFFNTYFLSNGNMILNNSREIFSKTNKFKKYTMIDGGSNESFACTLFKGLKFTPKSKKKLDNVISKEFIKGSEYNGYKFSVIVSTSFDENSTNSILTEVIENKKFKFIVLVIKLNLSDENISYLNRKLLYELDHKIAANGLTFEDSVISGALDLRNANLAAGVNTVVNGVTAADGSQPQFLSQILKDPSTGTYSNLRVEIAGQNYKLKIANVINDYTLLINGEMTVGSTPQPTQLYTTSQYKNAEYSYANGGIFAHKELLQKLSANNIANLLNNTNNTVYTSIEEDGSVVQNSFKLEMDDGIEIIKTSTLYPEVDINKPKSFGLSNEVIGYNIEERNEYYAFLVRQNGEYTVDMKPIVTFSEPFSMHKIETDWTAEFQGTPLSIYNYDISDNLLNDVTIALYKKLNGCNVLFNVGEIANREYDNSWGVIKNHFFHKVNEIDTEGVIKLSESDDLLPKYNLIGEIAIDKIDKNVFKSRWEDNYYVRSLSAGKFTKVPGTKNIIEEKSYGASSMMKVSASYDIYNFTINQFDNIEQLDDIKRANVSKHDINFTETDTEIILDFYLDKGIIKLLDNLGVRSVITNHVAVEDSFGRVDSLEDDISEYISNNILPIYSIDKIDFYVLESKKINTEVEIVNNASEFNDTGYLINNNFTYKLDPANPLNFRLIYNKRIGYSYKIRPLIKIKS